MNGPAKYLVLVLSSLTLLACGGGDDSNSNGTSNGGTSTGGGIIGGGTSNGGVNGGADATQGTAGSTSNGGASTSTGGGIIGGGTSNGGVNGGADATQGTAGSTSNGGASTSTGGGIIGGGTNNGGVNGVTDATQGVATPSTPVASTSLASAELAKYEGVWQQACVNHMRRTTTLAATSANVFTVTPQENFFANADCTGAIVATGSFGKAQETVKYSTSLPDASVKLLDGTIIQTSVDPATSTLSIAPFVFTGSGVRRTLYIEGGKTLTTIAYASGDVVIVRDAVNGGVTAGGLALRNGELLALVPVAGATTSFAVNQRFFR